MAQSFVVDVGGGRAAANAPVVDCHSDVMIDVHRRRRQGESGVLEGRHLPRLREGGVAAAVCTVGGDAASLCPLGVHRPYESTAILLDELEADVSEGTGRVGMARSASGLRSMVEDGVFAVVPALEGASPLEGDPGRLEELVRRGVRSVGLTWNTRNELATGLGHDDGGLTDRGVRAVRAMNRLGVVIDVSHLGPVSFRDVLAETRAPVMASHSNARAVHEHPRNLDDAQLDAIAGMGGLVGVVFYPEFVGPAPVTLDDVLDHVEYLAGRMGVESVGVGADFIDYALVEVAEELEEDEEIYDPVDFAYPEGLEDCRRMGNLLAGLRERGFTDAEVRLVAGGNFLRLMEEVEETADA